MSRADRDHREPSGDGYSPAAEPAYLGNGSTMAHAASDPIFWATMAVAEQDFHGAGDLCLRCHTPLGWLAGRSTPTDGSSLSPSSDSDGVECDLCHRLTDPVSQAPQPVGVQSPGFFNRRVYSSFKFGELVSYVNILRSSFLLALCENSGKLARSQADRQIFELTAIDLRRHLAFGIEHIKHYVQQSPQHRQHVNGCLPNLWQGVRDPEW